ncbi:MAG: hypothetical protein U5N86_01370 [Planctomycetota bacterium]|nr:hypothetical protein [Planctomycetota bacterium]
MSVFHRSTRPSCKPGAGLAIELDGEKVGYFGQVGSDLLSALEMKSKLVGCEIDLAKLCEHAELELRSFDDSRIPRYPSTERDFAFIVDEEVQWGADVEKTVRAACDDAPLVKGGVFRHPSGQADTQRQEERRTEARVPFGRGHTNGRGGSAVRTRRRTANVEGVFSRTEK